MVEHGKCGRAAKCWDLHPLDIFLKGISSKYFSLIVSPKTFVSCDKMIEFFLLIYNFSQNTNQMIDKTVSMEYTSIK